HPSARDGDRAAGPGGRSAPPPRQSSQDVPYTSCLRPPAPASCPGFRVGPRRGARPRSRRRGGAGARRRVRPPAQGDRAVNEQSPLAAGVLARSAATTRVADRLARRLRAHGIRHAFGMPGGEVVTFVDALESAGIRFVLMRQESGAAMAAAATSLTTGAPGLLVTTIGPGLANAVNGIADAVQERMPLLVVSGVVDRPVRGSYTHQVLDQAALLRGAGVKASFDVAPEDAEGALERALALAMTPPYGPVHLDLAPGIAASSALGSEVAGGAPRRLRLAADPADPALADLRRLFERAERPLVIAGFEAARAGPDVAAALGSLVDRHGVPVVTTYKAKGVVDETAPLALGAAGLSPAADSVLLPLVRAADLVLAVGYDPIEMRPGWHAPFAPATRVVELGEAPADHGMHRADLALIGPIAGPLQILARTPAKPRWVGGEPAAARARLESLFAAPAPWGPHAVFETLRQVLPESALLTVDSGAHRILLSQSWRARRPLAMLQSAGWCTMGSALPLAIGAALGGDARPIVAALGDGGLEMTMGELGTLRDQGLPVIVVVLQDASLALIELKQRQAGLDPAGVALGPTDYAAVAAAFGGVGHQVGDASALAEALRAALGRDRFSVIACTIGAEDYVGRL
ncbi:MAG: thiamine pyrophosphate-binding protein, partial [Methylobacteriaceae bacterium]|nr:thiamine pyrophosphate-binding protein [Methylobacteriaceae bacterium]